MTFHGIDFIYEHWVDTIFRKLRNFAGLEHSVVVLITAEIIAAVLIKLCFMLRIADVKKDLRADIDR